MIDKKKIIKRLKIHIKTSSFLKKSNNLKKERKKYKNFDENHQKSGLDDGLGSWIRSQHCCDTVELSFPFDKLAKKQFSLCKFNNCEKESRAKLHVFNKKRINTNSDARKLQALFFALQT